MKKNIVETEGTSTMNHNEEKEFVNPIYPRYIYDRAIEAKNELNTLFVESDLPINSESYDAFMTVINSATEDVQIAASCGEFTYNFGHGWEFKMPSTRDIMARLQKSDENPDLRYTIRFSQTVSQHKDQFGTTTEKLVRYFYIRKFSKEEHNVD